MAGIGDLFGGLAKGLEAGMGIAQRQQALQQHQQTIDLERQKQDIALQQIQGAMADSKAISAALAPAADATKQDAQGLEFMALLRDAAGMDPQTRKTQLPVMFAQFKKATGQDIAPNMQEFIGKAPSETLVPLIDSATVQMARGGSAAAIPAFTDPRRSAALIANRTAKLQATADDPLANPQAMGVQTQVAQTQRLIDLETQKLQNLQTAASRITTQAGLEKFTTLMNATEQRIQTLNGQLNALNTQNAPKTIGHGGALVTPTGQVLYQAPDASKLLPPDVEAQQIRIAGAKAQAGAQARQDVADAATPDLSPEALSRAAAQYNIDGSLPALGRGAKGVKARLDIIEEATQQAADAGDTSAEAAARATMNKAVLSGYRQLEAQGQKISAFEKTAKMNADKALEFAGKVDNTGVPIFNRWVNAGKTAGTDDPDLAAFNTYVNGFRNEYARIVTTATGGGVTTDTARAEFDKIINTAQAPDAFKAAISAAKQEMDNRLQGFEDSRQEVRAKFLNLKKGGGDSPTAATPAAPPVDNNQYTKLSPEEEKRFREWADKRSNGHTDDELATYDLRGAWKDVESGKIKPDDRGHLADTYKKPNHITFSDGSIYAKNDPGAGKWSQDSDGKWTFTVGATNLRYHSPQELRSYFAKYEPNSKLVFPKNVDSSSAPVAKTKSGATVSNW